MASTQRNVWMTVVQVVLAIVIVVLAYVLYQSITEPYKEIERQERLTQLTRQRMSQLRSALVYYQEKTGHFPPSLDSLVNYLKQDSLFLAKADSILGLQGELNVPLDSLIYSPRTGKPFIYMLNDTSRVEIYLLKDPDSNDSIGSRIPDITLLNAASWE